MSGSMKLGRMQITDWLTWSEHLVNLMAPGRSSLIRTAKANFTRETQSDEYQSAVRSAQERIKAGDAFQIVLSQRFATSCNASALDVYEVLREANPSPYMFLFRIPELTGPDQPLGDQSCFRHSWLQSRSLSNAPERRSNAAPNCRALDLVGPRLKKMKRMRRA